MVDVIDSLWQVFLLECLPMSLKSVPPCYPYSVLSVRESFVEDGGAQHKVRGILAVEKKDGDPVSDEHCRMNFFPSDRSFAPIDLVPPSARTLLLAAYPRREQDPLNLGLEAQSMVFFRFKTYVKSKDLDLWHVITNGDFHSIIQNSKTKLDEVVPFEKQTDDLKRRLAKNNKAKMVIYNALLRKEYERIFMCNTEKEIWKTLLITHQGNNQVKDNKIDLLVQQYEQFVIFEDESIDSAFARFNTIITSLKALDKGYSSKNYVRKFLGALHPKWRAKVTAIEESKDLTSLSLDELTGNLKVHEMIIKKDSKIVKEKVERKSLALKAKKESSDEECSTFGSEDEYRDDKNRKSERKCFRCGDPNYLIGECPKPPRDKNQKAFIGGSWGDSDEENDEKIQDETCLVAQAPNEICLGVDLEPDEWIKDSGCSKHLMGNQKLFSTYKAYNGGNVVFCSNLRGNIIGKGQICDNKCKVTFSEHDSKITKDGKVIGKGIRKKGLYVMKLGNKPNDQICLITIDENSTLWHRSLGHANMLLI
nr:zf-CCHC domain-containing protein/DUF4219 domain-containing protein/UBN2 domain-containing protein [Tanacetum cinerariifolium]